MCQRFAAVSFILDSKQAEDSGIRALQLARAPYPPYVRICISAGNKQSISFMMMLLRWHGTHGEGHGSR